jgi:hypothetical protein
LLLLAAMAASTPASGQSPTAGGNGAAPNVGPNGTKRNGARNGPREAEPPPYVDKLIADGQLPPDIHDELAGLRNADGWPRALRVELFATRLDSSSRSTTENGIGLGGFLATPGHGFFTLDGTLRKDGGTVVLWQRDVPFDGGWRATNGLGTVSTAAIDLSRTQPRFVLPSAPLFGAGTEWRTHSGTQLTAAAGEPGFFSGIRVPRFERLGGTVATAGFNGAPAPGWTTGVQWIEARNTALTTFLPQPGSFDSRSVFGAAAWEARNARFQANMLTGSSLGGDARHGGWVDAVLVDGRLQHGFGAFYVEPDLYWGNQGIASDLQGVYYRGSYRTRQWLVDGGVDLIKPVTDGKSSTTFVTGSARHQFSRDVGAGAGVNWLHSSDDSWSAYAFFERNHPWGIGRLQLDAAEASNRRDLQLKYEQTWAMPAGTRLSTAAAVGRLSGEFGQSSGLRLQAVGGGDIVRNLSIDGNVSWTSGDGDRDPGATYANVGLSWRFARDFLFTVGYYENRTEGAVPVVVTSPIALPTLTLEKLQDRGVFLSLRFDTRAGSPTMALGGPAAAGIGRIAGVVYLDANDDGRLDAGETGAANVTVLLDGRFSARTDGQGRFEFPAVVAGRHHVTVLPDNLPLPWTVVNETQDLDLPVRGSVHVELPARRSR